MTLTDAAANSLASHLYRNVLFDSPQIWMGLLAATDPPVEIIAAANPGYARVQIDTSMAAPVEGVAVNNANITLPTATGDWGDTVVAIGIWDAETAGTLLQVIALPDPVDLVTSQAIRFPIGALELGFATETITSGGLISEELFEIQVSDTKVIRPKDLVTEDTVMLFATQDKFPFWHDYSGTVPDNDLHNSFFDITGIPDYIRRSLTMEMPDLKGLAPAEWILPMEGTWRFLYYQPDSLDFYTKLFFDWSVLGESEATNILYRIYIRFYNALFFFCEDGVNGETNRSVDWLLPKIKNGRHYCCTVTRDAAGVTSAYINGVKLNKVIDSLNAIDTTGEGDFSMPSLGGQDGSFYGVTDANINESLIRILEMKNVHETELEVKNNILNDTFTPEELSFIRWDDFTPTASTVALLKPDPVTGWVDLGSNNTTFESTAASFPLFDGRHVANNTITHSASISNNPHLQVIGDLTIETVFYKINGAAPIPFVGPYIYADGETESTNYLFRHYLDSAFWEYGNGINAGGSWPTTLTIEENMFYRSLFTVKDLGDGTCTARLLLYDEDGNVQDSGELITEMWTGGEAGNFIVCEDGNFYRYIHIKNEHTII